MRKELEKYGIQMPAFSKIGGILESEVSIKQLGFKASNYYFASYPVLYSISDLGVSSNLIGLLSQSNSIIHSP